MTVPTSNGAPSSPPPSLAELSRRATVDKTDMSKYSIKSWIATVAKLYEQGDFEYRKNCLDNAYVHYMKGCSIMVEVIAKHQNFKEAKKDVTYRQLKARTSDDILMLLEELSAKLQYSDPDPSADDYFVQDVMNKYPPLNDVPMPMPSPTHIDSNSFLDNLPSVPKHMPSNTGTAKSTQRDNSVSSNQSSSSSPLSAASNFMKMPEPQPQPQQQPTVPPKPSAANILQLPTPSPDLSISPTPIVDARQLASWIVKRSDGKQPSVLILDVRPRQVFDQGFIKHKWIAQIEPLVLKQDVSSKKIEESMVMNPDAEQQIFAGRHHFDLVVYYDQNSQSLQTPTLNHLRAAIYELEFQKILQRAPVMLSGGFDAWKQVIGEKGIFRYTNDVSSSASTTSTQNQDASLASSSSSHQKPHWLKDVVGRGSDQNMALSPVKVHHTFYDYFSNTGSSGNKESMTRYTERSVATPLLRGVFSNTLYQPSSPSKTSAYAMPIPQPSTPPAQNAETSTIKYPDVRPSLSNLQRKKTFIDNPFHGFTSTTNQHFDVPPLPPKPQRPLPDAPDSAAAAAAAATAPVASAPPLPPKVAMAASPTNNAYRTAPVSDNSFSQMGNVMIGTTGLKNLGNTCFMNSIIQCLSGTIPFARYFISGVFRQHINKDNFLGTGGVLAENFASLLRTMWSENYNFISPVLFREALIKFAPQFRGSEQHDSQEFLNFLLDGIHEDCNLVKKRPSPPPESAEEEARFEQLPDWQASGIAWERYLERNSSVIVSLFQGQYRSRLTCLTCQATSTTYNSFMSLSLPIPAKRSGPSSVSIYQCLDYFVKEEILDHDDAWQCPKCKTLRRASKSLTLSKLPDVLLIHLKRFSFDGPFKDKLETIVESPMSGLDLSRYVPSTMFPPDQPPEKSAFNYDLYAVSNHFGSLTGGHYTACVRNGYKNEWHNFDDSRFSVCDESKVLSRAAYNLFYVRSTVK
ncbi:hypothetical protein MBANPS3_001099 [Mucor bainieri]